MNNEKKRDVFEYYLEMIKALKDPLAAETVREARQRYDAALPDDLPVIPKAVSEWIKECKHNNTTLADTLCMEMRPETVRSWMAFKDGDIANDFDRAGYLRKQDLMARAWVLGVWRVEETCEVIGNVHENPELLEGKHE